MGKIIFLAILLSGCQLYGGASFHIPAIDSEYREQPLITTFGASQEIDGNIEVFIEHNSMPFFKEEGYGVNQMGIKLKTGKL